MTLCEVTYNYQRRLSEANLSALSALRGQLYGLRGFDIDEAQNRLRVSYDASRVTLGDLERALRQAGIAVQSS